MKGLSSLCQALSVLQSSTVAWSILSDKLPKVQSTVFDWVLTGDLFRFN
ncbi:rCG36855 [Rattus norvegicus]|uniref:RCG36855 n=1 Tax=Rattus norvegicus TaxID=10116 RepID=A6HTY4_RAT|nr:rCG36855 [Rattus norvegicus]